MTKKKSTSMRLPWAQWDFEAWETDAELLLCSFGAQALWMRLLCIAWKNDGYVLIGGQAPSAEDLAFLFRQRVEDVEKWLEELERRRVFSRKGWAGAEGVIYSRRMVREKIIREQARINGAKGGNPALLAGESFEGKRPVDGKERPASKPRKQTEKPEGVNPEIEREIEIEKERESVSTSARAKKSGGGENTPPRENPATWDSLEYRGDTLRTVLEAEKIGEVRKDEEGRKGEVWFMAAGVMRVLGQMPDKAARASVAEIVRTHGLDPDELAEISLAAFEFGPNNPRAYFASQAAKIVARRK